MIELQNTLTGFFEQFVGKGRVRITGENRLEDGGIDVSTLPIIDFSYATSDYMEDTVLTFNIWTHSTNWIECLTIENRLAQELPAQGDALFDIKGSSKWEYRNHLGIWVEFDFVNVVQIAQEQALLGNFPLTTNEIQGKSIGGVRLMRGSPFTQSVTDPNFMIKRRMGNIIMRSFLIH